MKTALIACTISLVAFVNLTVGEEYLYPPGVTKSLLVTPARVSWVNGPGWLPRGIQMAILEGDPSTTDIYTLRLKLPNDYRIPPHWHDHDERITVISGKLFLGLGDKFDPNTGIEFPPGSYIELPYQTRHSIWTQSDDAIIQLHGIGPWGINYIEPKDDPRKAY